MRLIEMERHIQKLEQQLLELEATDSNNEELRLGVAQLIANAKQAAYKYLTPEDKVYLARHPLRPNAKYYINELFSDFIEMHGDRLYGDDQSIIGGIGLFEDIPVTIIAQIKGKTTEENIKHNFGMPHPEGYRKVQRLAKQAEKFGRPIITFIDTPGAYPGIGAEERGQAEAIAKCLMELMELAAPIIAIVIGEGGSGGALALSVADHIVMLENSIYSVLSPEGFASILWKDAERSGEAAKLMKLTAEDLMKFSIIDTIIKEPMPMQNIQAWTDLVVTSLKETLARELTKLRSQEKEALLQERYKKFRVIGANAI